MIICPLCSEDRISNYFNDNNILQCQSCMIVFLAPNLKIKDLNDYYNQGDYWQDRLNNPEIIEMLIRDSKHRLKLISKFLLNLIKPSLLDIGSHEGTFIEEANKKNFKAIGIEPNQKQIKLAQQRGLPLYAGKADSIFPRTFDVITMFHVLEHLKHPRKILKKLHADLRDDGLLILEVPNIESYLAKQQGSSWKFIAREHLFYFSPETLTQLLSDSNFKVLKIKKRNFEIRYLSINKIFHYFWASSLKVDRFQMKNPNKKIKPLPLYRSFVHIFLHKFYIKDFLANLISLLGREDHVLIIAQKN